MKSIIALFACFTVVHLQGQTIPKLPNTIPTEQKLYELSMIWKEVAYNFDNFQNNDQQTFDSLYRAYIPKIIATTDNLDYYKTIQQFLAHCNNGHTKLWDWNDPVLDTLIARPYLRTAFRNNKIIVTNFADYNADRLTIGDEIIRINGENAVEYVKNHYVPFFSVTNKADKMHRAMFAREVGFFFGSKKV